MYFNRHLVTPCIVLLLGFIREICATLDLVIGDELISLYLFLLSFPIIFKEYSKSRHALELLNLTEPG